MTSTSKINQQRKNIEISVDQQKKYVSFAQKFVLKCVEDAVSEGELINAGKHMNQAYYEDIIEERQLQKICGYPVCRNRLKTLPKQQYHISTKANKVYDITERRNFCCNVCYQKSNYFKSQLQSCPVWLIVKAELEDLKLLKDSLISGLPGQEFDLNDKNLEENIIVTEKPPKVNENEIQSMDIKDTSENLAKKLKISETLKVENNATNSKNKFDDPVVDKLFKNVEKVAVNESSIKAPRISRGSLVHSMPEATTKPTRKIQIIDIQPMKVPVTKKYEKKSQFPNEIEKMLPESDSLKEKFNSLSFPPYESVKSTFFQWMTPKSVQHILGMAEFSARVTAGRIIAPAASKSPSSLEKSAAYAEMCRRLDLEEQEEQNLDQKYRSENSAIDDLQPLPDFENLKEDTERMNFNVSAFFHGKAEKQARDEPNRVFKRNISSEKKKSMNKVQFKEKVSASPSECADNPDENTTNPILPPVHHHSQNYLRKNLVMKNFNIIFQNVLSVFDLNTLDMTALEDFVSTFNLTAENICLRPKEWSIATLICLKLVSRRCRSIEEKFTLHGSTIMESVTDGSITEEDFKYFIATLLCD